MKKLALFIALLAMLPALAQQRDKALTIAVSTAGGAVVTDASVKLTQTDYSLSYGTLKLNAQGAVTVKVYAGNHRLEVSKAGYDTHVSNFQVTADTTVNVTMAEQTLVPFSLGVDVAHDAATGMNDVTFTWNQEAPVFFDDFESYEPWIMDGIGNWKVYDGDKAGTLQYSDIWVPNAGKEMAFEVFNTTDEEFETATRRKFLIAHSGVQYLMAFDPSPSCADQSDDWLISPLLSGEAQTISFFAKSCASNYPETFEVMYSTTDDDPESFVNIETFPDVKGGLEWTEYNIPLPEGTKYFAIHVITVDGLAFQLDDITYRPATLVVDGYKVYRDGQCVATTAKDQTTYTDTVAEDGTHVYQVSVCYTIGESQLSNEAAVLTAIQFVDGSQTLIRSEHGQIVIDHAEGKAITVYTPDGKEIFAGQGRRHLSLPAAAGQYIVTVGGQPVNLIVR